MHEERKKRMLSEMAAGYDFRPTGFPELDAINRLISLADEYAKNGDLKKK